MSWPVATNGYTRFISAKDVIFEMRPVSYFMHLAAVSSGGITTRVVVCKIDR